MNRSRPEPKDYDCLYVQSVPTNCRSLPPLSRRRRRQILEGICITIGYLKNLFVDQGSEFISRDLDLWSCHKGVVLDFSRPGNPTDNGFIKSFNGKFRAECLNTHWFMSLDAARTKMEAWRRDYNEVRPHSAIGNKPPISLLNGSSAA